MKVITSKNAVGKSLNEENLENINGEPHNQDTDKVKLDELKKLDFFQSYKQAEDLEQFRISWKKVDTNGAHIVSRFRAILQKLTKVLYSRIVGALANVGVRVKLLDCAH